MFLVDKSDTSRTSVIVSEPKLVNEGQDVHISLSEGVSFSASVNSLMCVARVGEA